MNEREQTLARLLALEEPVERVQAALSAFPWDSDTEVVLLSFDHIAHVLRRYLAGKIDVSEVENWANVVEGRDDIGFESRGRDALRELLHELANPLITHPLTIARAKQLLVKIQEISGRGWNVVDGNG